MLRPVSNPPDPWASTSVEWLGEPPVDAPRVHEETARTIVAENDSPDIPFRYSVNPYRGCSHACAYCYARPTHEYLGWGAGTDFDRHIVAKVNAPELLAARFERPDWTGELLAFSGVTDCYQPLEAGYELTRRCLAVCLDYRNPAGLVTKSALVRRDAQLLAELHEAAGARVWVSIPFADDALCRALEPGAPPATVRFATIAALSAAGVPTGVLVAPIIPGLAEEQLVTILTRAREAGASAAGRGLLRLPPSVGAVFRERLAATLPLRAARVEHALDELREGRPGEARFGKRQVGAGPRWAAIEALFDTTVRRLGLRAPAEERPVARGTFKRPGELF